MPEGRLLASDRSSVRTLMPPRRWVALWDAAAALLLLSFLVFVACTFRDYGITLDEWLNQTSGELVLQFYTSLGVDRRALSYGDLYYYGPWYQVLVAFAGKYLPYEALESRHLIGGLAGVATAAASWILGRQALGAAGGFLTLVFLLTTGYFIGNVFNNPIDAPFMLAMTLSLTAINAYLRQIDRPGWPRVLLVGVAVGLAFAIRIGGVLYLFNLFLCQIAWLALRLRQGKTVATIVPALVRFAGYNLMIACVAFAVTYALWPWLWPEPVQRLLQAAMHFSHMPLDFEFPFFGRMVRSTDLPAWYIPGNLVVRLPEGELLAIFALLIGWGAVRGDLGGSLDLRSRLIRLNVGLGWVLPLVTVLVTRPVLYDGFRHLLLILPPLAVTAAGGVIFVLRRWRRLGIALTLVVAVSLGASVTTLIALHPYEYVYFNHFVGGPAGAVGRFEMDYWGAGVKEATMVLQDRLREEQGADADTKPVKVEICNPWGDSYSRRIIPPEWRAVEGAKERPDFAITFDRNYCREYDQFPIYAQVLRGEVVFATVRDLRHGPDHAVPRGANQEKEEQ